MGVAPLVIEGEGWTCPPLVIEGEDLLVIEGEGFAMVSHRGRCCSVSSGSVDHHTRRRIQHWVDRQEFARGIGGVIGGVANRRFAEEHVAGGQWDTYLVAVYRRSSHPRCRTSSLHAPGGSGSGCTLRAQNCNSLK